MKGCKGQGTVIDEELTPVGNGAYNVITVIHHQNRPGKVKVCNAQTILRSITAKHFAAKFQSVYITSKQV